MRAPASRHLARVALFLAVASAAPVATAQPKTDRAGALERFDAGQKLFDQKQYDDALVVFRKVYADTQSPNARLMVARCYLALGQTAVGYDELSATVREAASKAQTEPKYARTRDAAAAELAALEPRVGKVIVVVVDESTPPSSTPPAVSLTSAGASPSSPLAETKLPAAKLGVPVAVLPGPVTVVATRADGVAIKREERIVAGETKTVTVVLKGPAPPALAPVSSSPIPPPVDVPVVSTQTRTGGQVRVAGFVTGALGIAGFAVFGATFAVAHNDYDSVKNTCGGMRCTDPKVESTIDSGKSFQLASNVALPIASVLTVAGVGMIVLGGPKRGPQAGTGRSTGPAVGTLDVSVRPGGIGATMRF